MELEQMKELHKSGDWICMFKGMLGDGWRTS